MNNVWKNISRVKSLANNYFVNAYIFLDCENPQDVGNGFCDDYNNKAECNYDSGDCCGSCVNKQFFSFRIRCGIANSWNEFGNGFVINNETISLLQLSWMREMFSVLMRIQKFEWWESTSYQQPLTYEWSSTSAWTYEWSSTSAR